MSSPPINFTLSGTGDDLPGSPRRADSGPPVATGQAAVVAALTHGDSRQRRIASQVAAGRAGAFALADPAIPHHGINTSRHPVRPTAELGAERFQHR